MAVIWSVTLFFLICHYFAFEGLCYMFNHSVKWQTTLWFLLLRIITTTGVTGGAHRLWTHRTFKANLPLRIILCVFQTTAFQLNIFQWVLAHRLHHKYSDTDGDPHNASRGFFYSHIGCHILTPHPEVTKNKATIDMSDFKEDQVVRFQKKYYLILATISCFVIPTLVPWYFWNEDWYIAFTTAGMLRYVLVLHAIFLVNSAAHIWGTKPYDKHMKPTENKFVATLSGGEGWHNYHHCFPWDYKAAELDTYSGNQTTAFIDFMAKIGWAYDLKVASKETIQRRIQRTGDALEEEYHEK